MMFITLTRAYFDSQGNLTSTDFDYILETSGNDTIYSSFNCYLSLFTLEISNENFNLIIEKLIFDPNYDISSDTTENSAGTIENLILTGKNNIVGVGNNLDNQITGNSGNNLIIGGSGSDTLTGGNGNDVFFYNSIEDSMSSDADLINDFVIGKDIINLSSIANISFDELTITYSDFDNQTFISGSGANNQLLIKLSGNIQLQESDFVI